MGQELTSAATSLRFAALTCVLAAISGLVCYWVGATRAEEPFAQAARPAPVAPKKGMPNLLPLGRVSRLDREALTLARDRAYREGREDGLAEGKRAGERLVAAERLRFAREARRAQRRRPAGSGPRPAAPRRE